MAVLALLQKKLQFFRDKVKIDAGDVDRSSVGDARLVANWNARFTFALSEEGRELQQVCPVDPRVSTISICTSELNQCGGSTAGTMMGTINQGVADLIGLDGDAIETVEMVHAVATLMEALLTKANVSEISRLAILGRIVMRELGGQTWGKDAQTRNALLSSSVQRGFDAGCGFSTDDWFESGEAAVAEDMRANVVPLFVPGDVRVGLEDELQLLVGEEEDAQKKLDSMSNALEEARRAQEKAWDEAQEAEMRRVIVTNELFLAQNKRRRTGPER